MIIVTGGAGFIGSALIWKLNEAGINDIVVVDRLGNENKWKNLVKRQINYVIHKDEFFAWLKDQDEQDIEAIFHMGACSATTENNADYLMDNNVLYSIKLFEYCTKNDIPFIYASSAATYGSEESNFSDDIETIPELRPINKYGYSKHLFDTWVLKQKKHPKVWYGFKFFNVYGPGEYHKNKQASVAFHAFNQIEEDGCVKLFKSYRKNVEDGEQKRDFVYIKDVVNILHHVYKEKKGTSGIYNIGTGKARSFMDLGEAVFKALDKHPSKINWIKMPDALKKQYQYFTQANLSNLKNKAGYLEPFHSLEEGVHDYVTNYLMKEDPYL